MRIRLLPLFLLTVIVLFGCGKDEKSNYLELSTTSFTNISYSGDTLEVDINSDLSWTVSKTAQWCTISPASGTGSQKLSLIVDANLSNATRTVTISVIPSGSGQTSQRIEISQEAGYSEAEKYQYELPVIFHVLYKNASDATQYISASFLSGMLSRVNEMYADATNSQDMNITFTLATTDPDGNTLSTPGVEYVQWTDEYPIDCEAFMYADKTDGVDYVKYLWEPNDYINVMVYNFKESSTVGTILGVSHMPYTPIGTYYLEGTNESEYSYLTKDNLAYPYCVSINSLYTNKDFSNVVASDINVTLAHELGHYLGLYHVFSETEDGGCEDTDYCADTQSYNYEEYLNKLKYFADNKMSPTFETLVKRESCNGSEFTSYNIMDYDYSYCNQFTSNQRQRTRHVLMYGLLMPGPKVTQSSTTRSAPEGIVDLPIIVMK